VSVQLDFCCYEQNVYNECTTRCAYEKDRHTTKGNSKYIELVSVFVIRMANLGYVELVEYALLFMRNQEEGHQHPR